MVKLTQQTRSVSNEEAVKGREWFIVDADGETVGRVATKIAAVLRGKNKPSFTTHIDTGDFVIVVNAEKVRFTGKKMDQKEYISYSLYPGGQKHVAAKTLMAKKPTSILEEAIRGMLPKTKLGRAQIKKLNLYAGPEHPHAAQMPKPLK